MKTSAAQVADEEKRLAALRMQFLELHPFWGYILLQMRLIAAPKLPALAMTDCVSRIWFDPRRTAELGLRELGFVLLHEICHQVLATHERRQDRDPYKWNMATDYAINDLIADIPDPGAGKYDLYAKLYEAPAGALLSSRYHGWIAETIYEDLCRKKVRPMRKWVSVSLPTENGGRIELADLPDFSGGIDLHLPVELNDDQRETLRTRIAAAVDNYHANNDRGSIPDELLRRLQLLTPPKLPWRRLLHQYADAVLHRDDYSLAVPNKRFLMHDVVVPGYYSEEIGSLAAAVDTSGSMTEEEIREVLSELRGMVDSAQEMTLIVADCKIQRVVSGEALDAFLRKGELTGGGGTDHVCVFDYIAEHGLRPSIFVGMTDLFSNFPARQPPYPVLWLVPKRHADAPWGRVIEI